MIPFNWKIMRIRISVAEVCVWCVSRDSSGCFGSKG